MWYQALLVKAPDTTHVASFGPKGLSSPETAATLAHMVAPVSGNCMGFQVSDWKAHTLSVPSSL